ncbi:MAG TPA: ArsA-related P-loop ATPase, partial [Pseudomonadota bacterium]|nr:ArsA-related P-loop ATPase [Pseudomonadota bacterium]
TTDAALSTGTLADVISSKRIVMVVGSGGVGKTTTSATLGLLAALRGRRVLVLTIDPARRLADALSVSALSHEIQKVPEERLRILAAARGETPVPGGVLDAMMLDQKRAFDDLVARYATDPKLRDRVLRNQIYQQISSALAGSHEYAAMSRLYELSQLDRYDLLVMDTPPTENAIDFLDAPDKMAKAVDSETIQWIMKQYLQQAGSLSLRLLGMGGTIVLKGLGRFLGSAFLTQVAEFFVEFQQVLAGFRERAQKVTELMQKPEVAFLLACSPEPLSIDEAVYFHERLTRAKLSIGGCIVNRVHSHAREVPADLLPILQTRPELSGFASDDLAALADELSRTYAEQRTLAAADEASIRRLGEKLKLPLSQIPLLEQDVHDAASMAAVSRHLIPPAR